MTSQKLTAEISINTKDAQAATTALRAAMRNLNAATVEGSKNVTSHRANVEKLAQVQRKLTDQNIKLAESFNKVRQAELKGQNDRKIAREESGAKVGLTGARTDEVNLRAASSELTAQGKQQLLISQKLTDEARRREMILNGTSTRESRALRDQVALREQATREQRLINSAINDGAVGLGGMRYALHDISSQMMRVGALTVGLGVGVGAVAASWERDFANVERVTQGTAAELIFLRSQLVGLATTMPVAFEDLTKIATLGGQMGISETNIASFTKTVAQFAATTDVSVEDTATAFGRLNSLIPDIRNDFTGLADSVARVGVKSVATESQILRVATQISSLTGAANFGYKATVALAGSLASVAVPPELSRGVITRVFGTMSRAVSEGGVNLTKFGEIAGMTGKQFADGWTNNAPETLLQFMDGLHEKGTGAEAAIRELGITSVRDVPVLLRLANAADSAGVAGGLMAENFKDANDAAGELQRQYSIIAGTTSSKIQVLFQNVLALADKIGATQLGALGDILDNITRAMRSFGDSLEEPAMLLGAFELPFTNADVVGGIAVITALIGVLALFVAGLGQVIAGGIAVRQVIGTVTAQYTANAAAASAAATANTIFAVSTKGVVTETTAAGAQTRKFSDALKGAAKGLAITAGIIGAGVLLGFAADAAKATTGVSDFTNTLITSKDALDSFLSIQSEEGGFFSLGATTDEAFSSMKDFRNALKTIKDDGFWADFGHMTFGNSEQFRKLSQTADLLDTSLSELFDAGNSAKAIEYFGQIVNGANLSSGEILTLLDRTEGVRSRFVEILGGLNVKATDANLTKLARGTLPEYNRAAEDALQVTQGTADAFDDGAEGVGTFLDTVSKRLGGFLDFNAAYQASLDSANAKAKVKWVEAGNDVADFVEVAEGSLDDFLTTMEQQVAAQQAFAGNLATVLREQGPDIAAAASELTPQVLQQLVDGGPEAMDRFKNIVVSGGVESVAAMATDIASFSAPDVQAAFAQMGDEAAKEWITKIIMGQATIDELLAAYKPKIVVDADINPALTAAQNATAQIGQMRAQLGISAYISNQGVVQEYLSSMGLSTSGPNRINIGQFATGGGVSGPGTATSDSIPARLSDGEHVFTARDVTAMGGQRGVYEFRKALHRGNGFATGGQAVLGSSSYASNYSSAGRRSRSNAPGVMMTTMSPDDRALMRGLMDRISNIEVEFVAVSSATRKGDELLAGRGGRGNG